MEGADEPPPPILLYQIAILGLGGYEVSKGGGGVEKGPRRGIWRRGEGIFREPQFRGLMKEYIFL